MASSLLIELKHQPKKNHLTQSHVKEYHGVFRPEMNSNMHTSFEPRALIHVLYQLNGEGMPHVRTKRLAHACISTILMCAIETRPIPCRMLQNFFGDHWMIIEARHIWSSEKLERSALAAASRVIMYVSYAARGSVRCQPVCFVRS